LRADQLSHWRVSRRQGADLAQVSRITRRHHQHQHHLISLSIFFFFRDFNSVIFSFSLSLFPSRPHSLDYKEDSEHTQAVISLLKHLVDEGEVTCAHALHALRQLAMRIDDLTLDVPHARVRRRVEYPVGEGVMEWGEDDDDIFELSVITRFVNVFMIDLSSITADQERLQLFAEHGLVRGIFQENGTRNVIDFLATSSQQVPLF
jgi:hypothetical protein